jgi:hypothetical protein
MVWPSKTRSRDFDGVSESYTLAARDVEGSLLPAGDAWREAWRRDPSLALYADDGFHPSRMGSYLAALAIWRGLSAQPALGLPGPRDVAADTLRLLQESVDRVATVKASPAKESAVPRWPNRRRRPAPTRARSSTPPPPQRLDSSRRRR